jgi:hypothetical protein
MYAHQIDQSKHLYLIIDLTSSKKDRWSRSFSSLLKHISPHSSILSLLSSLLPFLSSLLSHSSFPSLLFLYLLSFLLPISSSFIPPPSSPIPSWGHHDFMDTVHILCRLRASYRRQGTTRSLSPSRHHRAISPSFSLLKHICSPSSILSRHSSSILSSLSSVFSLSPSLSIPYSLIPPPSSLIPPFPPSPQTCLSSLTPPQSCFPVSSKDTVHALPPSSILSP